MRCGTVIRTHQGEVFMSDGVVPGTSGRRSCAGGFVLLTAGAAHPCLAVEMAPTQARLVTRTVLSPQEDVVVRGTLAGLGHFETQGRVVDQESWGSGGVYLTRIDLLGMPRWAVAGLEMEGRVGETPAPVA